MASQDANTITQVALLQSLLQGDYYGSVSFGELKRRGDTGLGTFNRLDGELVLVDGVAFRAKGDGTVEVAPDDETTPFANVGFLRRDDAFQVEGIASFEGLVEVLDAAMAERGANNPALVRIDGRFSRMYVRSVAAQSEPYPTLVDALAADQSFCEVADVEGSVVGLYFPPYMKELNNAGWHLHFVSADGKVGGHVLDLAVQGATVYLDRKERFEMLLPSSDAFFDGIDFTRDRSEEVRKAETNK